MKLKTLVISLVTVLTAACAGMPTGPYNPPKAVISAVGNLSLDSCLANRCSNFHFSLTNSGVGCANALDLRGTITLTTAAGTKSTATWKFTDKEAFSTGGFLQPGETKTASPDSGTLLWPGGESAYTLPASVYKVVVTKQINWRCV